MLNITLVGDNSYLMDSIDDCNNVGPCCFTCPAYDACDNHFEGED